LGFGEGLGADKRQELEKRMEKVKLSSLFLNIPTSDPKLAEWADFCLLAFPHRIQIFVL
jgi:hypothetical protein